MQRYYQVVMSVRELNEALFGISRRSHFTEKTKPRFVTQINSRFVIRDNDIDTTDESVFVEHPSALLELFAIMGEKTNNIEGIRASTIRQIRLHRKPDRTIRSVQARKNRALFIAQY